MILQSRQFDAARFEAETGWQLKPEGACKGDLCIPVAEALREQGDAVAIAGAMGLPVVEDPASGLISIGPESIGGHALTSAEAPHTVLPDLDGKPFDLATLRGQKVLLYAWAPY